MGWNVYQLIDEDEGDVEVANELVGIQGAKKTVVLTGAALYYEEEDAVKAASALNDQRAAKGLRRSVVVVELLSTGRVFKDEGGWNIKRPVKTVKLTAKEKRYNRKSAYLARAATRKLRGVV